MDSDEGKLFIGGIAWDTTEDKLGEYFNQYGDVSQAVIMRDKTTGRPRGFGFVVFSDPSVLDQVLQDKHTIDGRTVEAKRALSREEQHCSRSSNFNSGRSSEGGYFKTKKIFVGGLPPTLTEDGFRQYFENYGHVTDVVVMYDQNTQRPRGFGFITFDTEDAVDNVLQKVFHELNGKLVEVKRALPKDTSSGGGGRSGGYQGYNAPSANSSTFDGRMDGNRYMQPQSNTGGFPTYSGYGAPGYGYGAASSAVGFGGYGSYGMGGYGSTGTGFVGPTGAYGNPSAGYMGAAPGSLKSSWGSQNPSSYGTSGYDANTGFGPTRGAVPPSIGPSPSGASGYASQGYGYGYGYGNYGGGNGPYSGGYGAAGGLAGNGAGGDHEYGDTNGNSGYTNAAWRSDSSQSSSGYSGGYGGAHSRQTQ